MFGDLGEASVDENEKDYAQKCRDDGRKSATAQVWREGCPEARLTRRSCSLDCVLGTAVEFASLLLC
jgi:hypothetical protein